MRAAIDAAEQTLAAAGIGSAAVEAEQLAAHVLGIERGRLRFAAEPGPDFYTRYQDLVAARARRIPQQHLTGTAPFGPLTLQVGPGVFIPRPETEALYEWAANTLDAEHFSGSCSIVDLCTGSGALAVALATYRPTAQVLAVDDSPEALAYAARNAEGTAVRLVEADVTTPDLLHELDGTVDLLVSNPPYIPDGVELEPEVAQHDPHHALFGGVDGMTVINAIAGLAGRWLRPAGRVAIEHDDTTAAATVDALADTGKFRDIQPHRDLAGRPRFVTAVRSDERHR
ncbi:protein-(glutamine-N5) methyltransferase, release factor-specific [Mycobacterium sp. MS1601]|uniref:peptide chain release factor N(5)-glutamine methyltransferase n=1 Tax=Mycobacterium sp. MS1601 TaxID=1936029 RepID=UPI0009792D5A|nr:peptide chain release factor N(5)-glutamine methyltransferase [Mycobacterium sp. MS1601]AQA04264.1 protein-(glutamine-N5) methyltransferase, release factor-specific [Mycobacterium sp. MS1601]